MLRMLEQWTRAVKGSDVAALFCCLALLLVLLQRLLCKRSLCGGFFTYEVVRALSLCLQHTAAGFHWVTTYHCKIDIRAPASTRKHTLALPLHTAAPVALVSSNQHSSTHDRVCQTRAHDVRHGTVAICIHGAVQRATPHLVRMIKKHSLSPHTDTAQSSQHRTGNPGDLPRQQEVPRPREPTLALLWALPRGLRQHQDHVP